MSDLDQGNWIPEVLKQPPNPGMVEKLDTRFYIPALVEDLKEIERDYPPHFPGPTFGGWSVLSSNGDYTDGWHKGHRYHDESKGQTTLDPEQLRKIGIFPPWEYNRPTAALKPQFRKVLQTFANMKLFPCRARIVKFKANSDGLLHRDATDNTYAVRAQIPIITNENCFIACKRGWLHMPADGSTYLFKVNCLHQIFNHGDTDRYHLIVDVYDKYGVTRDHKMPRLPSAPNSSLEMR